MVNWEKSNKYWWGNFWGIIAALELLHQLLMVTHFDVWVWVGSWKNNFGLAWGSRFLASHDLSLDLRVNTGSRLLTVAVSGCTAVGLKRKYRWLSACIFWNVYSIIINQKYCSGVFLTFASFDRGAKGENKMGLAQLSFSANAKKVFWILPSGIK